jgi:hypothetical protein
MTVKEQKIKDWFNEVLEGTTKRKHILNISAIEARAGVPHRQLSYFLAGKPNRRIKKYEDKVIEVIKIIGFKP